MPVLGTCGGGSARGYGLTSGGAKFELTWSPGPAGSPFTTGSYTGVDFTASATVTIIGGGKDIEYVVVAGGGAANEGVYSGGGAGGYRSGTLPLLNSGTYTVTVGAGGSPNVPSNYGGPIPTPTQSGSPSVFGTITSTGGGTNATPGGSGGGGWSPGTGGTGNTPPTSPPQGNPGGNIGSPSPVVPRPIFQGGPYTNPGGGGGGGGAGGAGSNGTPGSPQGGGAGGPGTTTLIKGPASPLTLAGGGNGAGNATPQPGGGGIGNPFAGSYPFPTFVPFAGSANTGGGGGGNVNQPLLYGPPTTSGGSGRVIIRWIA